MAWHGMPTTDGWEAETCRQGQARQLTSSNIGGWAGIFLRSARYLHVVRRHRQGGQRLWVCRGAWLQKPWQRLHGLGMDSQQPNTRRQSMAATPSPATQTNTRRPVSATEGPAGSTCTHMGPRSLKPPSPGLDQYCLGQVPHTAHAFAASRSAAAASGEGGCKWKMQCYQ